MKIKRGATFDIVRCLCILWIVGVWHMKDYLSLDITDEAMHFGELITTSLLGAFTFMSGFFLKKYEIIYKDLDIEKNNRNYSVLVMLLILSMITNTFTIIAYIFN